MQKNLVLVTGGSGFVGSHCIVQLLKAGFQVRTTVRSLSKKDQVIAMIKKGGFEASDSLSFFEADLEFDKGWDDALKDCEYVLHVATPISVEIPKNDDEVIRPAVEGTLRVLKAAKKAGIKRIVLTSSFAAIGYGNKNNGRPFDETDWTNIATPGLSAYVRSKALAEKAAWDFMNSEGAPMEMAVVNPMAIFGPLLGKTLSSGHHLLKQLIDGTMKAVPHIDFGIVDVRDVADLHLKAMIAPEANGQRFLDLAGGTMSFHEIAMALREGLGARGEKITKKTVPTIVLKLLAPFSVKVRQVLPMVGQDRNCSNEKAKKMLGWKPRSNREAVIAAGESIVELSR